MVDMKSAKPVNMTRVLVETKIGPLAFAFYKDGMFRIDGEKRWRHPDEVRSWISIRDLRNKLSI